jgi:hypothetical protein
MRTCGGLNRVQQPCPDALATGGVHDEDPGYLADAGWKQT